MIPNHEGNPGSPEDGAIDPARPAAPRPETGDVSAIADRSARAFDLVGSLLRRVGRDGAGDERLIHRLRVATRRAEATVEAAADGLPGDRAAKIARRLRKIRRAAAAVRRADVLVQHLDRLGLSSPALSRAVLADRDAAAPRLVRLADRFPRSRVKGWGRRVAEAAARSPGAAAGALDRCRARVGLAAERDLVDAAALHTLRVELKGLRYLAEAAAGSDADPAFAELAELQESLGRANDLSELADRIESAGDPSTGFAAVAGELRARHAEARDDALRRWAHARQADLVGRVVAAAARPNTPAMRGSDPTEPESVGPSAAEPSTPEGPRSGRATGSNGLAGGRHPRISPMPAGLPGPVRLAAIDVGSNSIRLIVAEADPDRTYRVLDDEREVARLGQGLAQTGRIGDEQRGRARAAVAWMAAIARGYGVAVLRVVATAAVRDASNSAEVVADLRAAAGVDPEVIDGQEEARLAFLSASRAFDLSAVPAAVVEIGGGSTQILLTASGVVESSWSLPMGAVRLTDAFGGPEASSGDRYREMRDHIDRRLRAVVGRPPLSPAVVVGTGGTFTTLAAVVIQRAADASRGTVAVQGYDVQRSDLRHALDLVRKTPVRSRARIPGLPADRADIAVAGLAIADAVLAHLGANRVRVHDRGVRDGVLLETVEAIFPQGPAAPASRPPDRLASARRFAQRCRYEAAHAEHVTRLALELFDRLAAAGPGGADELDADARIILEAAGVLHDVGYLINYAQHHKHSYHLIMHSSMEGFTAREVELIANVARYHRKSAPKKSHAAFAALPPASRRLVRTLAAILRVADGLDRTHTQAVRAVHLGIEGRRALLTVAAEGDAATDLWGADRKSRLFRKAFGLNLRFAVVPAAAAPTAAPAEAPHAARSADDSKHRARRAVHPGPERPADARRRGTHPADR